MSERFGCVWRQDAQHKAACATHASACVAPLHVLIAARVLPPHASACVAPLHAPRACRACGGRTRASISMCRGATHASACATHAEEFGGRTRAATTERTCRGAMHAEACATHAEACATHAEACGRTRAAITTKKYLKKKLRKLSALGAVQGHRV